MQFLDRGIHSKRAIVRKGAKLALLLPRSLNRLRSGNDNPPAVIANSFPKSGTHLLEQIVGALPGRRNYGTFLSSMTESYDFRERSKQNTGRFIHAIGPGEVVRGHLFHDCEYEGLLREKRIIHFFIYRDLRDVVLSEAYYLKNMNRWHKLHKYFRKCETMADAISLAILGLRDETGVPYPDVAQRFARFRPWLDSQEVFSVRFEDLVSDASTERIRDIVKWYGDHSGASIDLDESTRHSKDQMKPARSHTFRSGKSGGWQEVFTKRHCDEFKAVAGDLLVDLGYEHSRNW